MDCNPNFAQTALTHGMSEGTYSSLTGRHSLRKTYGRNLGNTPVIAVDVGGTVEDTWPAKRSWWLQADQRAIRPFCQPTQLCCEMWS